MAEAERKERSCEEQYRERLKAGGFMLEPQTYKSGLVLFLVRNAGGHVVFGSSPFGNSATLERVENFLKAQKL